MNNFIREFFNSDLCEASKSFELSETVYSTSKACEAMYKKLEENLSKEDFNLLEEYIDAKNIVSSEETFHAYVSGMRDIMRFVIGAFTEL